MEGVARAAGIHLLKKLDYEEEGERGQGSYRCEWGRGMGDGLKFFYYVSS